MQKNKKIRYEGLDQLRGILAFTVMIYHYFGWQNIDLPWMFQKPLDLLGLYAVGSFYALSGCALYIVYHTSHVDRSFMVNFWIKRSFRIIPLFFLVTSATIALILIKGGEVSAWKAFLNYSLLFSWASPSSYIATGSWSIGNEWAFYMLFPILIWGRGTQVRMFFVVVASVAIAGWYWFYKLNIYEPVANQWAIYVEPMNQFPLFLGGFLAGGIVINP